MTIFSSNEAVDMTTLPEIALLAGGELQIDFAQDNLALGHIDNVSYLLSGRVDGGIITGVTVIKVGEIAYQFSEMLIIPDEGGDGDELNTLDKVLQLILDGDDRITGSSFSDTLIGLTGRDRLEGLKGDDTLIGGEGADQLSGGGGRDTFVMDVPPTSGKRADTILDFNPDKDLIGLDHLAFAEIGNRLSPKEFHIGGEATHSSERIIYNDDTGALFFDADGKGKTDQVKIAMLDPGLDLKSDDFLII